MATPAVLSADENHIWRSLLRLSDLLRFRIAADVRKVSDLSVADHSVLFHLAEAESGRMLQQDLASSMYWSKSRMSHQLARMEDRGLLSRMPDSNFDEASRKFWTDENGPLATFIHGPGGGPLDDQDETVRRANPITYLSPATPPFLLLHGTADMIISPSQALLLHNTLRAAGRDAAQECTRAHAARQLMAITQRLARR
jgi:acetyl esterase/lipase